MNLASFLRAFSAEQFSCRGIVFQSENEAEKILGRFPSETMPEQMGRIILYDSEVAIGYLKGVTLPESTWWNSLIFRTSEQAQIAATRIEEQLQTPIGVKENQIVFPAISDGVIIYQAIASSVIETVGYQVVVLPGIPDEDWVFLGDSCWIPLEFKEEPTSPNPQILVRDLDAFEAGIDRTVWINATQEHGAIAQMITWWLRKSPVAGANWWTIIDSDGFPPRFEPEGDDDLVQLSYIAQQWQEHGDGFWVYYRAYCFDKKARPFEKVKFLGCYSTAREYFRNSYDELWNQGDFEPEFDNFEDFCEFYEALYIILHWQGNEYIYDWGV